MRTKEEMFEMIRVGFCELVKADKVLAGRTLNYFDPVPNKQFGYNIFIADSKTGFCLTIPVPRKNIHCLEKDDFKAIMAGVLLSLTKALKEIHETGKPAVDYTKLNMRAGRRSSLLDKTLNLGAGTIVNLFRWTTIILPYATEDQIDMSQQ